MYGYNTSRMDTNMWYSTCMFLHELIQLFYAYVTEVVIVKQATSR